MKLKKLLTIAATAAAVMAIALAVLLSDDIALKVMPQPTMTPVPWEQAQEAAPRPTYTPAYEYEAPSHSSKYGGVTDVRLTEVYFGDGDDFISLYKMEDTDYLIKLREQSKDEIRSALDTGAIKIKQLAQNHPDVKFYVYYVTRATDMDWYVKNDIHTEDYAKYIKGLLSSEPSIKFDAYDLPDFAYYMDTGYKTDFHVNYKGSYKVYQDLYAMMNGDLGLSPLRVPVAELDFGGLYYIGDLFTADVVAAGTPLTEEQMDKFAAYKFDLGEYHSFIGDKEITIGQEEEYEAGQMQRDPLAEHQFTYYGGQMDVVRFEFGKPDAPNLLMISDSQGRPSRKPLASHFNTTIFYDDNQWRALNIDEAIENYDIDAVLIIGQTTMFEIY